LTATFKRVFEVGLSWLVIVGRGPNFGDPSKISSIRLDKEASNAYAIEGVPCSGSMHGLIGGIYDMCNLFSLRSA
jgi:hypothetical protein